MSTSVLRVGLIGLGKMGQNHLRVLSMLKSVEIVFVHDANAELEQRMAAAYGIPAGRELSVALTGVDAVVIATPTSTHLDYIKLVARHVRNIFVEKPVADSVAGAEEVANFAEQNGLRIQVGFIERFNPAIQVLKNVLDKSERVVSVDFTRTNKLSARIVDVDVVTDLMIHDIDLALFINGPVKEVTAHGIRRGVMIDFASAMLAHENGRFSRIQASRITEKKMRAVQATCTDIFVDCELLRKEVLISRQSEVSQQEGEPYVISALAEFVEVRPQEALLTELQAFVSFSLGGAATVPSHQDGLAAMQICERIQQAVAQ